MTGLAGWLTAQVDDDEAAAKAAQEAAPEQSGRWHAAYARGDLDPSDWLIATAPLSLTPAAGPGLSQAAAMHIARYDPARALREAAFKRKVIAMAALEVVDGREVDYDVRDALDEVLRDMAEVYRDRPGYQQVTGSDPAQ
jgi:hypothetical protein